MAADPNYDLAGVVIGCAMRVHRTLGPGYLESVYKKALHHALTSAGLDTQLELPIKVYYDGVIVGEYFADVVINKELILEIKAVSSLAKVHEVQLVNYLTATGMKCGLLLNFGSQSLEFKKKFRRVSEIPDLHS